MLAKPLREGGFVQSAGGNSQHRQHAVPVLSPQLMVIQQQEKFNSHKGRALVAVDEWVVARNAAANSGPVHLANSRNTWRRFFITSRAPVIWASKSAL